MKKLLFTLILITSLVNLHSQSYNMINGVIQTVTVSSGTLYDSGGPSGNYMNNENSQFLIKTTCQSNIDLTFSQFYTELNYDYLRIYDGNNTGAPILGGYWGGPATSFPTLTATSGSMLIVFYSDYTGTYPGFTAHWNFTNPNCAPIANFNMAVNTCQGKVNFTDASAFNPTSWLWNFGDGNATTLQNPVHTYTAPGSYQVTLIATNAFGNSTITKAVSVNPITFKIGHNGTPLMNAPISFTTDNTTGQVYTWDFGDGGFGGTANAIHTYTSMGTFNVGLTIASGSCITTVTTQLVINNGVGIQDSYLAPYHAVVSPNPSNGRSHLDLQLAENSVIKIEVINQLGQLEKVISENSLKAGEYNFELNDLSAGIHYVKISEGGNSTVLKVVSLK